MVEKSISSVDVECFVNLLTANQQKLYRYIVALVPDLADADDVFQETSIILWRKYSEYVPEVSSFSTWACGVAFNVARKAHSKQYHSRLTFDESLLEAISQEARRMEPELDRRREALVHCVSKLSDRDRDLLHRRYEEGATIKKVATAVGRPVHGLYKAFERIHQALVNCVSRTLLLEGRDE